MSSVLLGSPVRPYDQQPSAREHEYARYLYSRPIGSADDQGGGKQYHFADTKAL